MRPRRTPTATTDGDGGITRFGVRSLVLVVLASLGLLAASAPASAQACTGGTTSDFNGDGEADLVIGDPDATVSGAARSGSVHIAYGDGATQTITQQDIADNDNAAGDRFGSALASTDWDGDGCSDLFIGVPFEAWANNTKAEAGVVVYIPGSPSGLDTAAADTWGQTAFGTNAGSETGDRFGYSLAAGTMENGTPFLVAGAPGESVGTVEKAGMVIYATPEAAVHIHQDSAGVPGVVEAGDLYGYSVAASPTGFVIGAPGEAIGDEDYAGTAHVFAHNDASQVPPVIGGIDQDSDGVSGVAEVGDWFGYAVDMVDYITSSGAATLVAVSTPGEDGGSTDQGGVWEFDAAGTLTQWRVDINQGRPGVGGGREDGDFMGMDLALVNRSPGQVAGWDDVLLAVGVPGEDSEEDDGSSFVDRGWVQGFSLIGEPGDHYFQVDDQLASAGIEWQDGSRLGASILADVDYLYVADPWSDAPAVYAIPWVNLTSGATDPVKTYTPSDFGLDAADVASFGAALA